jgi:hypothetical protein
MSTQFSRQGKMKVLVLLAVMLGGVGSFLMPSRPASASHQSKGVWANAVSGCAIDAEHIGNASTAPNRLQHQAGAIGGIVARCNVENLPLVVPGTGEANTLQLVFRDPDGPGSAYVVFAQLQQLTNTGNIFTLAQVNSGDSTATMAFQTVSAAFTHDFNFNRNAYFVEIIVVRHDTAKFPGAATVRLLRSGP